MMSIKFDELVEVIKWVVFSLNRLMDFDSAGVAVRRFPLTSDITANSGLGYRVLRDI